MLCDHHISPPAHGDVSLDGDGERHVDGGTEGDSRHGVQEVDVDLQQLAFRAGNEPSRSFTINN